MNESEVELEELVCLKAEVDRLLFLFLNIRPVTSFNLCLFHSEPSQLCFLAQPSHRKTA